jgi:hypothetical protein
MGMPAILLWRRHRYWGVAEGGYLYGEMSKPTRIGTGFIAERSAFNTFSDNALTAETAWGGCYRSFENGVKRFSGVPRQKCLMRTNRLRIRFGGFWR